jgi:hypothetical protein
MGEIVLRNAHEVLYNHTCPFSWTARPSAWSPVVQLRCERIDSDGLNSSLHIHRSIVYVNKVRNDRVIVHSPSET